MTLDIYLFIFSGEGRKESFFNFPILRQLNAPKMSVLSNDCGLWKISNSSQKDSSQVGTKKLEIKK